MSDGDELNERVNASLLVMAGSYPLLSLVPRPSGGESKSASRHAMALGSIRLMRVKSTSSSCPLPTAPRPRR